MRGLYNGDSCRFLQRGLWNWYLGFPMWSTASRQKLNAPFKSKIRDPASLGGWPAINWEICIDRSLSYFSWHKRQTSRNILYIFPIVDFCVDQRAGGWESWPSSWILADYFDVYGDKATMNVIQDAVTQLKKHPL